MRNAKNANYAGPCAMNSAARLAAQVGSSLLAAPARQPCTGDLKWASAKETR